MIRFFAVFGCLLISACSTSPYASSNAVGARAPTTAASVISSALGNAASSASEQQAVVPEARVTPAAFAVPTPQITPVSRPVARPGAPVLDGFTSLRPLARPTAAPAVLFATGPIESACRAVQEDAKATAQCGCVQAVANLTLSPAAQRRGAAFFKDPQRAQDIRQSSSALNAAFWEEWAAYGAQAETLCD